MLIKLRPETPELHLQPFFWRISLFPTTTESGRNLITESVQFLQLMKQKQLALKNLEVFIFTASVGYF